MIVVLILVTGLVLLFIYERSKVPKGLPPGSFGWPVLGTLPPRNKPLFLHLNEMKKKYGKIFTTKWGTRVMVIICDPHLAKKALTHPDIQGKNDYYTADFFAYVHNSGIFSAHGAVWSENRKFVVNRMRNFGVSKSKMTSIIEVEAEAMVDYLSKKNLEQPVELDVGIELAVLNIIWMFSAGTQYSSDDPKIRKLTELLKHDLAIVQSRQILLDFFPWIVPFIDNFIGRTLFKTEESEHIKQSFSRKAHELIEEHRQVLDPNNPQDFIDYYLLEIENEKDNPDTIFKEDYHNLVSLLKDLYLAGSASVANSMRWTCLYLATTPEVQKKIHEELDREIPHGRLPSFEDKQRLTYLNATILEIQRRASTVTNGVIHSASVDVNFEGYFIPKDTGIMTSIEMFHYDPELWEKPNETYPEHFINSEGKLVANRDGFMPFQLGPHRCVGESIARTSLFFFTAALLQRFEISAPPGVQLDLTPHFPSFIGRSPSPFKVMLKKRS